MNEKKGRRNPSKLKPIRNNPRTQSNYLNPVDGNLSSLSTVNTGPTYPPQRGVKQLAPIRVKSPYEHFGGNVFNKAVANAGTREYGEIERLTFLNDLFQALDRNEDNLLDRDEFAVLIQVVLGNTPSEEDININEFIRYSRVLNKLTFKVFQQRIKHYIEKVKIIRKQENLAKFAALYGRVLEERERCLMEREELQQCRYESLQESKLKNEQESLRREDLYSQLVEKFNNPKYTIETYPMIMCEAEDTYLQQREERLRMKYIEILERYKQEKREELIQLALDRQRRKKALERKAIKDQRAREMNERYNMGSEDVNVAPMTPPPEPEPEPEPEPIVESEPVEEPVEESNDDSEKSLEAKIEQQIMEAEKEEEEEEEEKLEEKPIEEKPIEEEVKDEFEEEVKEEKPAEEEKKEEEKPTEDLKEDKPVDEDVKDEFEEEVKEEKPAKEEKKEEENTVEEKVKEEKPVEEEKKEEEKPTEDLKEDKPVEEEVKDDFEEEKQKEEEKPNKEEEKEEEKPAEIKDEFEEEAKKEEKPAEEQKPVEEQKKEEEEKPSEEKPCEEENKEKVEEEKDAEENLSPTHEKKLEEFVEGYVDDKIREVVKDEESRMSNSLHSEERQNEEEKKNDESPKDEFEEKPTEEDKDEFDEDVKPNEEEKDEFEEESKPNEEETPKDDFEESFPAEDSGKEEQEEVEKKDDEKEEQEDEKVKTNPDTDNEEEEVRSNYVEELVNSVMSETSSHAVEDNKNNNNNDNETPPDKPPNTDESNKNNESNEDNHFFQLTEVATVDDDYKKSFIMTRGAADDQMESQTIFMKEDDNVINCVPAKTQEIICHVHEDKKPPNIIIVDEDSSFDVVDGFMLDRYVKDIEFIKNEEDDEEEELDENKRIIKENDENVTHENISHYIPTYDYEDMKVNNPEESLLFKYRKKSELNEIEHEVISNRLPVYNYDELEETDKIEKSSKIYIPQKSEEKQNILDSTIPHEIISNRITEYEYKTESKCIIQEDSEIINNIPDVIEYQNSELIIYDCECYYYYKEITEYTVEQSEIIYIKNEEMSSEIIENSSFNERKYDVRYTGKYYPESTCYKINDEVELMRIEDELSEKIRSNEEKEKKEKREKLKLMKYYEKRVNQYSNLLNKLNERIDRLRGLRQQEIRLQEMKEQRQKKYYYRRCKDLIERYHYKKGQTYENGYVEFVCGERNDKIIMNSQTGEFLMQNSSDYENIAEEMRREDNYKRAKEDEDISDALEKLKNYQNRFVECGGVVAN